MRLAAVGTLLGIGLSAPLQRLRAEIIPFVDERGRRIYINTEDEELRQAVARGGSAAAVRVFEHRKRSLPGIEEHLEAEARRHRIDPELVRAIIEVESAWNPRARSRKGALGLMQLLPATGARFGVRELFDPRNNVTAGIRYLRFLLDRFDNNLEWALAGYNAGENAVERAGGVPPYWETRQYVQRLRSLYHKLEQSPSEATAIIFTVIDRKGRVVYVNE